MNDPNKAIDVNLSSLLSLKAELLRKQAEVNKAKAAQVSNQHNEYASNNSSYTTFSNSSNGVDRSNKRDKKSLVKELEKQGNVTVYEHEDSELLEKSKRILESKSKFYDRMTRTGGQLNSDDNCLVLFNRKHQDERINLEIDEDDKDGQTNMYDTIDSDSDSETGSDSGRRPHDDDGDEDDWVEYTDCLGRTRKCLREDLEAAKKRDDELAASMPERLDQSKANWMIKTKATENADNEVDTPIGPMPSESVFGDGISIMSKHDEQRANWEKKEQENLDKIDVHYQDVFFDEARQHGVGYYAFSTDEEERKKQQKELEESRKRTIDEQKRRDELRAQREKIIAERVRAAKNRQRARLGLPPLEEDDNEKKTIEIAAKETKEERKARKRAEKLQHKQDQEDKERELARQQYVRPWDLEKDGVKNVAKIDEQAEPPKWVYKPERLPMSQEEWNEKRRAERITEFAPINEPTTQQQYELKRTNFTSMPQPLEKIFTNNQPVSEQMLPKDNFSSFQTSKKNRVFHRRNYESHNESEKECMESQKRLGGGAAIPPPADLEYIAPPRAKKAKGGHELEQSIEAGLRFLRDNCDKGNLTTKSSWTAKADY